MAKELFERIDRQVKYLLTEYVLLRLDTVSKSDKLTEENIAKHGFLRAPHCTKELEGDFLKFIERRF